MLTDMLMYSKWHLIKSGRDLSFKTVSKTAKNIFKYFLPTSPLKHKKGSKQSCRPLIAVTFAQIILLCVLINLFRLHKLPP